MKKQTPRNARRLTLATTTVAVLTNPQTLAQVHGGTFLKISSDQICVEGRR
jgi:hypothetical protein